MRLIQRLAVVAFAFFLFVVIRNVQAQGCVTPCECVSMAKRGNAHAATRPLGKARKR